MVSIEIGSLDDVLAVRLLPLPLPSAAATTAAKHIGLLFDTSGSMAGERLSSLQKTTELLIAAKPASYALTLVTFHSRSDVLVEFETASAPLLAAVAALRADGGTNLQEGIMSLQAVQTRHPMDAVLLLTDGDVTSGVSSVRGIVSLLESALPAKPPVHTIGIGESCNRELLAGIARLTRSTYMYADAAETLPAVVGDVLAGVEAEVGRAAALSFPEGVECLEPGPSGGTAGLYTIGSLIADKEQWVLFRTAAATVATTVATAVATAAAATMTLRYTRGDNASQEVPVPVEPTLSSKAVACQLARVECAKGFADIQERMMTGRNAVERATALLAFLNASIAKDEPMVIIFKAQVSELIDQLVPTQPTGPFGLGTARAPPPDALLSRLASNTSALTNQRGFVSRMASDVTGDATHSFSSPRQQAVQRSLTASYAETTETAEATVAVVDPTAVATPLRRC